VGTPLKWFPLDVDAFELDEAARTMTFAQRGIFVSLLCWQWREGSVPSDRNALKTGLAVRTVSDRKHLWLVIRKCFVDDGSKTGRLVNPKLAEVRVAQQSRMRGATNRQRKKRNLVTHDVTPLSRDGHAGVTPPVTPVFASRHAPRDREVGEMKKDLAHTHEQATA